VAARSLNPCDLDQGGEQKQLPPSWNVPYLSEANIKVTGTSGAGAKHHLNGFVYNSLGKQIRDNQGIMAVTAQDGCNYHKLDPYCFVFT
jgi:hypothetical protein